jgi:hypothetical protein
MNSVDNVDSDNSVLKEFDKQLASFTLKAACGRSFLLADRLLAWLKNAKGGHGSKGQSEQDWNRLDALIRAACGSDNFPEDFWSKRNNDCLMLALSVLLFLRLEFADISQSMGLVLEFLSRKTDSHDRFNLRNLADQLGKEEDRESHMSSIEMVVRNQRFSLFCIRFRETAWSFTPVEIVDGLRLNLEGGAIMPIVCRKPVKGTGATSSVCYIFVPKDLVTGTLHGRANQEYRFENKDHPKVKVMVINELEPLFSMLSQCCLT